MEIHRLKPMSPNYDYNLFKSIYKDTENLRNMLVSQINPRNFGVTSDIVKSWFDDKFIFVFNKYQDKMPSGRLKGFIINSLKTFKLRVLRKAYCKYNINTNQVYLEGENKLINIIPDKNELSEHELFLELALKFLKKNLSKEAFQIMEIELNPPPYITSQMVNLRTKIPAKLIVGYLGIEENQENINLINHYRKEVAWGIQEAKKYFKT